MRFRYPREPGKNGGEYGALAHAQCTALTPHIGYERAAEVAKLAHREDLTLRESCLRLGYMTAEALDASSNRPEKMV